MYIWVNALNRYVYATELDYDQILSDDYTLGRFVSGNVTVLSATTSGTLFNVAGTITASAFQEAPDIATLTYNQISSYKRNNLDVVTGVPVDVGVTALAIPNGFGEFNVLATSAAHAINNEITLELRGVEPGWDTTTVGSSVVVFDSNNSPGLIPPNLYGMFSIAVQLKTTNLVAGTLPIVATLHIDREVVDTADWTTVSVNSAIDTQSVYPTAVNQNQFFYLRRQIDSRRPCQRIWVEVNTAVPQTIRALDSSILSFQCFDYHATGAGGPGTILGVSDMSAGQTLVLKGCGNYEVVPNADLSKNITTNYFGGFSPLELELVTHYLANASKNGVRFVWETPQYKTWVNTGSMDKHLPLEHLATATGFSDFLSRMYKMINPVMKVGLPMLGNAVMGPSGALLGGAVASALPEASTYKGVSHGNGDSY
jgi:hypothetical protein